MEQEPAAPVHDDNVAGLARQLEKLRRNEATEEVVRSLEQRLDAIRREQNRLVWQFHRKHYETLHLLSTRLVGRNDAEDVAQEAFLSLARRIQTVPLEESMRLLRSTVELSRLMYRITTCRAYDRLRKNRVRQLNATEEIDERDGALADTSLPQPSLILDAIDLERAYRRLSPMHRIAHVLHHYYGFTDADFEATLGLDRDNSRSLVHRAQIALRRVMEVTP
jgi:DNA-directed RNA polymerase specialized sigma24 family protein